MTVYTSSLRNQKRLRKLKKKTKLPKIKILLIIIYFSVRGCCCCMAKKIAFQLVFKYYQPECLANVYLFKCKHNLIKIYSNLSKNSKKKRKKESFILLKSACLMPNLITYLFRCFLFPKTRLIKLSFTEN